MATTKNTLVALTAAALLAPAAASAGAPPEDAPKPATPNGAPPAKASNAPKAGSVTVYGVRGRSLKLTVACDSSGRVSVRRSSRNGNGPKVGSAHLRCSRGQSKASVRLRSSVLQAARSRKGLALTANARAGAGAVKNTLDLRGRSRSQVARKSAAGFWGGLLASCWQQPGVNNGNHKIAIPSYANFGARAGERVWWRGIVSVYRNGGWQHVYGNWDNYIPGGYTVSGFRNATFGSSTSQFVPRYAYSKMSVQSFSYSTGYRLLGTESQVFGPLGYYWKGSGYEYCYFT
jgi:hypothetical protein